MFTLNSKISTNMEGVNFLFFTLPKELYTLRSRFWKDQGSGATILVKAKSLEGEC